MVWPFSSSQREVGRNVHNPSSPHTIPTLLSPFYKEPTQFSGDISVVDNVEFCRMIGVFCIQIQATTPSSFAKSLTKKICALIGYEIVYALELHDLVFKSLISVIYKTAKSSPRVSYSAATTKFSNDFVVFFCTTVPCVKWKKMNSGDIIMDRGFPFHPSGGHPGTVHYRVTGKMVPLNMALVSRALDAGAHALDREDKFKCRKTVNVLLDKGHVSGHFEFQSLLKELELELTGTSKLLSPRKTTSWSAVCGPSSRDAPARPQDPTVNAKGTKLKRLKNWLMGNNPGYY